MSKWKGQYHILPDIQKLGPKALKDVTPHDFYLAVNKSKPSLIRTQADELTYCFHVMIRYELEKQLIAGTLAVKDLPAAWNALYKEYLGVDVPDDTRGRAAGFPLVRRLLRLLPPPMRWAAPTAPRC